MLLLPAIALAPVVFYSQLDPSAGLLLSVNGVPIVRGSGFQYYAPGWTKGYYASTGHWAAVTQLDSNTTQATWKSEDGLASAKETLTRSEGKLHIHYAFDWAGDEPSKLELTAGTLWGPAVQSGTLLNNGQATRSLAAGSYNTQSWDARRYGPDSTQYSLQLPFGNVQVSSSVPLTLFDARSGYEQDWAQGKELLWLGAGALTVEKGTTTTVDLDWQFETPASSPNAPESETVKLDSRASSNAYDVPEVHPPLIPRPRASALDWDHPLEITGAWTFPAGRFAHFSEFEAALRRRFVLPSTGKPVNIDGGVSKLGLTPGAYRITIRPTGISVVGEKDEGFRYGLQRVAQLAFVKDGKLYVPTGTLRDEPVNVFRGVHLFVGPQALGFQRKLVERVLFPLGMNKVVLQCERAAWTSLPGIQTDDTMSLEDLAKLAAMYRDYGFDPIPLIESFGHDEWLFANGKNLDIALNPKVPYAVDPRKPGTKELLDRLWDEVIKLLQPDMIHFGLDEVSMEGFPGDSKLMTDLWKTQLATLTDIAKSHGVGMMIWGDMLLGPNEAIDAMNGDTADDATARRFSVQPGTYIADWHYARVSDPSRYMPSLNLFAHDGFHSVASTWYQPANIRGFDLAAISSGAGTLQTTWSGYTSSENGMIDNFDQFAAMVLAADYGWSGRQDEIGDLDYDYRDIFRKMYFAEPQEPAIEAGKMFSQGSGSSERIGSVQFQLGRPIQLRSNATTTGVTAPMDVEIPIESAAKHLALALSTQLPSADGEPVADLSVLSANGKTLHASLRYGREVRAKTDSGVCIYADRKDGISCFVLDLGPGAPTIKAIHLRESNQYSGLQILGVTTY